MYPRLVSGHLCVEALLVRDGHPVEEQVVLPLPRPLLDGVRHVPEELHWSLVIGRRGVGDREEGRRR